MRSTAPPSSCCHLRESIQLWLSSTIWLSFDRSLAALWCCTRDKSSPRAIWTKCRTIPRSSRCIWAYECESVAVLTIQALNQFYGGSHTLWDVDLTVPAGSRMCLMGRNGMGKTTLLRCIMGLQPTKSGGIEFDGSDLIK